jgi:hypothetical protein
MRTVIVVLCARPGALRQWQSPKVRVRGDPAQAELQLSSTTPQAAKADAEPQGATLTNVSDLPGRCATVRLCYY